MNRRLLAVYLGTCLALLLALLASVSLGAAGFPLRISFAALTGGTADTVAKMIIWQIRVPRSLAAALVGAGLSLAGAVLQSLLRNPLAEPFTIGVASGAGFFVSGLAAFAPALLVYPYAGPLAGFAGAAVSGLIVFALAHRHGFTETAMALCGVILSFFFGALIMINFAFGRPERLQAAMVWMMGDVSSVDGTRVIAALAGIALPALFVFASAETLDVLGIGEERAASLGIAVGNARKMLFAAAALITGTCVAVAGIIGFVGFLIPHAVRYLVGARHRHLLPVSALVGALFLVLADTLDRVAFPPMELPLGAFTGVVGTIFFLLYYWRRAPEEVR